MKIRKLIYLKKSNFDEKNFLEKLIYFVFFFPISIIRDTTIPNCDPGKWNKRILLLNPICSIIFMVAITNSKKKLNF